MGLQGSQQQHDAGMQDDSRGMRQDVTVRLMFPESSYSSYIALSTPASDFLTFFTTQSFAIILARFVVCGL